MAPGRSALPTTHRCGDLDEWDQPSRAGLVQRIERTLDVCINQGVEISIAFDSPEKQWMILDQAVENAGSTIRVTGIPEPLRSSCRKLQQSG